MYPAAEAPLAITCNTNPALLTVSRPGTLLLTFARPPDAANVTCNQIQVRLPVGEAAADLVSSDDGPNPIDDWPSDTTGAAWGIVRDPPAEFAYSDWGEQPGYELSNMFDPSSGGYRSDPGMPLIVGSTLTVDYGSVQTISRLDIATGINEALKVPPLRLEYSKDGSSWSQYQVYMDTGHIVIELHGTPGTPTGPLEARYVRLVLLYDQPEEYVVIRYFLINDTTQGRADTSAVTFTCTPPGGQAVFDDARQFTLILASIPVNRVQGTAPVTVTETVAGTAYPTALGIDKGATGFVFENFSCEQPCVENGQKATLHWTGSPGNTTYRLMWDGQSTSISGLAGPACEYETEPLHHTTTFVLEGRTMNLANQTTSHYLSTTVTVANPDLEAGALTASSQLTVPDAFSADSSAKTTKALGPATFGADVTIT